MRYQEINLIPWNWQVLAYYDTSRESADGILNVLSLLGCSGESFERAEHNLMSGQLNTGLTYTNPDVRTTVMVVGATSGPEQFWNTLDHEKGHVAEHIAEALDIPRDGEEFQYLRGSLAESMYSGAISFVCPCRRKGRRERC